MHTAQRGQPHVARGFSLLDGEFQGGHPDRVLTGLPLRSSETGQLIGLRLQKSAISRRLHRAAQVQHRVVESALQTGKLAEGGVTPDMQPRVVDGAEPVPHAIGGLHAARLVAGRDGGSGSEKRGRGLVPRPVQGVIEGTTAVGELHRETELAVVRDDVREEVGAASLQVDVIDAVGELGGACDVTAGRVEVTRGRLDPGGE